MSLRPTLRLASVPAAIAAAALLTLACEGTPSAPGGGSSGAVASPTTGAIGQAKGGNGKGGGNGGGGGQDGGGSSTADPVVDDFDPKQGFQADTVDMTVMGSEFLDGDAVRLEREGSPADGTRTLSTTFVSGGELRARIEIEADAPTGDAEVAVVGTGPGKGRKGVGSELFAILRNDVPKVVSFSSASGSLILPDDAGAVYEHGVCGVKAVWDTDTDPDPSVAIHPGFFTFRPVDNGLSPKDERALARSCSDYPRSARLDISEARVVSYCVDPSEGTCSAAEAFAPSEEPTLAELAARPSAPVDDPEGRETLTSAAIRPFAGSATTAPGGLNVAYCLDDHARGRPLRFDPERNPGSSALLYTRDGIGELAHVETQPPPDNIGSCAHVRSNGQTVEILLRIDFAYDVTNP